MKIQYMSDLHMEFAENSRYIKHNEFPVTGDVLVLAGDTFYLNNTVAPLSKFWKMTRKLLLQRFCALAPLLVANGLKPSLLIIKKQVKYVLAKWKLFYDK